MCEQKLLADNKKEKLQKTESGKDEIEALKDQVSAKQLKEVHEEDSKKSERMAVDKDLIEQLKARVAILDRELQVAALVRKHEVVCRKIYEKFSEFLNTSV